MVQLMEFSLLCLQAVLETVAIITHDKSKKNDTQEAKYGTCINSTHAFRL